MFKSVTFLLLIELLNLTGHDMLLSMLIPAVCYQQHVEHKQYSFASSRK